jgi:hypothetical protein
MYLQVMDKGILVLETLDAARELLDNMSKISSDRPHFTMISELCVSFYFTFSVIIMHVFRMGWSWAVQFMGTGPRFRLHRKTVQACLHPKYLPIYNSIADVESILLLKALLENPSDKFGCVRQYVLLHLRRHSSLS